MAFVRHGLKAVLTKSPTDVVVRVDPSRTSFRVPHTKTVFSFFFPSSGDEQFITTLRTPIGKLKGALKDMYPEELLTHVLKATREKLEAVGVDVKGGAVQDIAVGTVLMELGGAKSGRLASLDAGYVDRTRIGEIRAARN